MTWKPDWLLRILLLWTTVTVAPLWFYALRAMMLGSEFGWKVPGWNGSVKGEGFGFNGPYLYLGGLALGGVVMLLLGWRGARKPIHLLLPAWHILLCTMAARHAIRFSDTYDFMGRIAEAQLGWEGFASKVPWIIPGILGFFALLSLLWAVRDLARGGERRLAPWSPQNEVLFWIVIAIFPLLLVLYRFTPLGEESSDQMASLASLLQLLLVNAAAYPWGRGSSGA
ncbi:hypothetical protein ABI59_16070 [Acidobacteria bacterium Mor1]|nr:hypothetical protein ABI59_16070 [Acidobacteria bacterium Mor1]